LNTCITSKIIGIIYTRYNPAGRVNASNPADNPIAIKLLVELFLIYLKIYNNTTTRRKVKSVSLCIRCAVIRLFGLKTINA
jgi:hypothetical protein